LDGLRESIPVRLFGGELFASDGGEFVELGLAAVVGGSPFGVEPAAFFEAMEGWIERALLDLEDLLGDLANAVGDAIAMDRAEGDDLEDEHVEGALEEVGLVGWHVGSL